jgi:hypothetical protein
MKTTFEVQPNISGPKKKRILENLSTLEQIWNIAIDSASVSFDYMTWADLQAVRFELQELGFRIINDTQRFDSPQKPI